MIQVLKCDGELHFLGHLQTIDFKRPKVKATRLLPRLDFMHVSSEGGVVGKTIIVSRSGEPIRTAHSRQVVTRLEALLRIRLKEA
jgi:hypothetical protein